MDFAPNEDGLIAPDQVARYAEFGDWQRACYVEAQASRGQQGRVGTVEHALGSAANPAGREEMILRLAAPSVIDRVVLREDQTEGQVSLKRVVWKVSKLTC